MANKWPLAAGVWSNAANWNGGTLPTSEDDVFADGKAVVIDQSLTVLSIRTTLRSGGTTGGTFTVNGSGFTINATALDGLHAGTSAGTIKLQHSTGTNTINGNGTGGNGTNFSPIVVATTLTAITNVVGNFQGAGATQAPGIHSLNGSAGTLNITGTITGGANTLAPGVTLFTGTLLTVNITGTIIGSGAQGVRSDTVSGTTINITGNCIANSAAGLQCTNTTTINHIGEAIASATSPGVFINGQLANTTYKGTGAFTNTSGVPAVLLFCKVYFYTASDITWIFQNDSGGNKTLYSAGTALGNPTPTDVRNGTTYGPSSELTGSLAVPPSGSVALGVPVDDGVGTAMISITDMGALLASYIV
jgi:hypothetical protein